MENSLAYPPHESEHTVVWRTFEVLNAPDTAIILSLRAVQFHAGPDSRSEFSFSNKAQNSFSSIANDDSITDVHIK